MKENFNKKTALFIENSLKDNSTVKVKFKKNTIQSIFRWIFQYVIYKYLLTIFFRLFFYFNSPLLNFKHCSLLLKILPFYFSIMIFLMGYFIIIPNDYGRYDSFRLWITFQFHKLCWIKIKSYSEGMKIFYSFWCSDDDKA